MVKAVGAESSGGVLSSPLELARGLDGGGQFQSCSSSMDHAWSRRSVISPRKTGLTKSEQAGSTQGYLRVTQVDDEADGASEETPCECGADYWGAPDCRCGTGTDPSMVVGDDECAVISV